MILFKEKYNSIASVVFYLFLCIDEALNHISLDHPCLSLNEAVLIEIFVWL